MSLDVIIQPNYIRSGSSAKAETTTPYVLEIIQSNIVDKILKHFWTGFDRYNHSSFPDVVPSSNCIDPTICPNIHNNSILGDELKKMRKLGFYFLPQ